MKNKIVKFIKIFIPIFCLIMGVLLAQFIFNRANYLGVSIFNSARDLEYLREYVVIWFVGGLYLAWRFFIAKEPSKKATIYFLMAFIAIVFAYDFICSGNFLNYDLGTYFFILSYFIVGFLAVWRTDHSKKYQKIIKYAAFFGALYLLINRIQIFFLTASMSIGQRDDLMSIGLLRELAWFAKYAPLFLHVSYFSFVACYLWQELKITSVILKLKKRFVKNSVKG